MILGLSPTRVYYPTNQMNRSLEGNNNMSFTRTQRIGPTCFHARPSERSRRILRGAVPQCPKVRRGPSLSMQRVCQFINYSEWRRWATLEKFLAHQPMATGHRSLATVHWPLDPRAYSTCWNKLAGRSFMYLYVYDFPLY